MEQFLNNSHTAAHFCRSRLPAAVWEERQQAQRSLLRTL
jgi:hypothetical protein